MMMPEHVYLPSDRGLTARHWDLKIGSESDWIGMPKLVVA